MLKGKDDEDSCGGKFVRALKKPVKGKKTKKPRVEIEYEIETERPARERY